MSERYSEGRGDDAGESRCRALLGRLLPGVDVDLLVQALEEEAARGGPTAAASSNGPGTALRPAERELVRVRGDLALGGSARMLQHSISNPLTALMAEAQLLELEPMPDEHRIAVARIVELARRVAAVVRRLEGSGVAVVSPT